jgi:hypothetical protein
MKHDDSKAGKEEVVELMVEYWVRTGRAFTGGPPVATKGNTPEEVLDELAAIVENRWCHHAGYDYQIEELRKALREEKLREEILESIQARVTNRLISRRSPRT